MKREKIDIDEILKRHWAKPSKEDLETSRAEVLERLRNELGGTMQDFKLTEEETPTSKVLRELKQVDRLVLRALQILDIKVLDFRNMLSMDSVVNELSDQPIDSREISRALHRLDRKGKISLLALFPREGQLHEAVPEAEDLKDGNWAKEKS